MTRFRLLPYSVFQRMVCLLVVEKLGAKRLEEPHGCVYVAIGHDISYRSRSSSAATISALARCLNVEYASPL